MSIFRSCIFVVVLLGGSIDAQSEEVSAGVARVEVTPPAGSPMGGYSAREGPSTGIHDPLYVTVLVLKSTQMTVAIISCDLRSFASERFVTLARERKLADHILIADKTPLAENADAEMRRVGETLGHEVARVSRSIRTESPAKPELAYLSEDLHFKNRWSQESLRSAIIAAYGPNPAKRYFRYLNDPIAAPVSTLVINRQVALVGLPGEPFVGLQLLLKQRSPLAATFLCGYANGYIGYFPTMRDAAAGGYGANTIVTRVEVGAGERMIDRGLIHIYRLLGKLKDKPEQP